MVDSETSNLPVKKRTSRRDEQSSSSNTQHDSEAKTRKKSKNASTADVVDIDVTEENNLPSTSAKKEKKMSKKRKREAEVEAEADEANKEEKDVDKKSKKRSKRAREAEPDVATTPVVSTTKRKNKTGFLDPNEDASLSDQTQKCLVYAFLQFHRPSKWKFNKARQNWLIRNIWSKEMASRTFCISDDPAFYTQ
ncbi:hypothetical protein FPV67DRAFT_1664428 [Lyophyllum atratum]|nr:hypothetical protein FPV67DRAFT_1664428 [Lyophyllum atratum]